MTMIWNPSPNFGERTLPITMLVLHYTGMPTGAAAIDWLANPASKVSAHYVVDEDGQLVHMVREEQRAQHAGLSYWRGITDCNSASIGIEIVNPGHEFGYRPFPEAQMDTVTRLVAELVKTYGIDPRNVVGHSDVAPTRKEDPGELFDWARLAKLGLAVPRPSEKLVDPGWTDAAFLLALERYGYSVADGRAAVVAFQRRFRQENIDGVIDGESRAILWSLLLAYEGGGAT
ncbi:N-acetylmuramoyl-L-alanine amidase [Sphingorhabdus lacus]|uniref:N-acetylmuramoyl-L-alanine amidase n=1 Tax=Sphingorhabdus lacus TaxID=392610 RepID=A0A6I6LCQ2_9SPHN|nr:N-acetylmuramoyl-L-alanine amidase [Sphingorhabdus lacus]QGY80093.1 N-acetylmuramoyl-L-alanine amidase [Sphingorhabdus lacus]